MNILKVNKLSKSYGKKNGIHDLSFELGEGEICGIIGTVGSGKTSIINCISGWDFDYRGSVEVYDKSIYDEGVKKVLGIVPHELSFYEKLTLIENIEFFGSLYGVSGGKIKENSLKALDAVVLRERKNSFPGNLTGGMKRRLNIACALAHKPKLLILDEPTIGIDAQSRGHIIESLVNLKKDGMSIVFTTRYIEDVEDICSKIILVDGGKVIAIGTLEELKEQYSAEDRFKIKIKEHLEMNVEVFKRIRGCLDAKVIDDYIELSFEKADENMESIMLFLVDNNIRISYVEKINIDLDKIFFNLTGKVLHN